MPSGTPSPFPTAAPPMAPPRGPIPTQPSAAVPPATGPLPTTAAPAAPVPGAPFPTVPYAASLQDQRTARFQNLVLAWEALCRGEDWDSLVEVQRDLIMEFHLPVESFDYENCRVNVQAAQGQAFLTTTAPMPLAPAPAPVPLAPTTSPVSAANLYAGGQELATPEPMPSFRTPMPAGSGGCPG